MTQIEIYTARYCPYCTAAKALLRRKGYAFTEIDIAANWERRDEMIARAKGLATVPQVFVGALHLGGLHELQELERHGKLDAALSGEMSSLEDG